MEPDLGTCQTEVGQESYLYPLGKDIYSYDDIMSTHWTSWRKAGYAVYTPYSESSSAFLIW